MHKNTGIYSQFAGSRSFALIVIFALMKIGFIGVGKIAGAIVEGLCTSAANDILIYLSPRNEEHSLRLTGKYPEVVHRMSTNQEVLDRCDIVFISVRPAVAAEVLGALRFDRRHMVISLIPLLPYAGLAAAVAPAVGITPALPFPTAMQHNCPIPLYRAHQTVTPLFGYIG